MISIIGLSLDIVGVLLMIKFNPALKQVQEHLDTYIKEKKSVFTVPEYSEKIAKKLRNEIAYQQLGMWLIVFGFSLQFIGSLLKT